MPIGNRSCTASRRRPAVSIRFPPIPDSTLSDDSVVVSRTGDPAYYYGQPLDDLNSPSAFHQLDLQTGRSQPVSLSLHLSPPVIPGPPPGKPAICYVAGDGDAFQIMRVPAASGAPAEPMLHPA